MKIKKFIYVYDIESYLLDKLKFTQNINEWNYYHQYLIGIREKKIFIPFKTLYSNENEFINYKVEFWKFEFTLKDYIALENIYKNSIYKHLFYNELVQSKRLFNDKEILLFYEKEIFKENITTFSIPHNILTKYLKEGEKVIFQKIKFFLELKEKEQNFNEILSKFCSLTKSIEFYKLKNNVILLQNLKRKKDEKLKINVLKTISKNFQNEKDYFDNYLKKSSKVLQSFFYSKIEKINNWEKIKKRKKNEMNDLKEICLDLQSFLRFNKEYVDVFEEMKEEYFENIMFKLAFGKENILKPIPNEILKIFDGKEKIIMKKKGISDFEFFNFIIEHLNTFSLIFAYYGRIEKEIMKENGGKLCIDGYFNRYVDLVVRDISIIGIKFFLDFFCYSKGFKKKTIKKSFKKFTPKPKNVWKNYEKNFNLSEEFHFYTYDRRIRKEEVIQYSKIVLRFYLMQSDTYLKYFKKIKIEKFYELIEWEYYLRMIISMNLVQFNGFLTIQGWGIEEGIEKLKKMSKKRLPVFLNHSIKRRKKKLRVENKTLFYEKGIILVYSFSYDFLKENLKSKQFIFPFLPYKQIFENDNYIFYPTINIFGSSYFSFINNINGSKYIFEEESVYDVPFVINKKVNPLINIEYILRFVINEHTLKKISKQKSDKLSYHLHFIKIKKK